LLFSFAFQPVFVEDLLLELDPTVVVLVVEDLLLELDPTVVVQVVEDLLLELDPTVVVQVVEDLLLELDPTVVVLVVLVLVQALVQVVEGLLLELDPIVGIAHTVGDQWNSIVVDLHQNSVVIDENKLFQKGLHFRIKEEYLEVVVFPIPEMPQVDLLVKTVNKKFEHPKNERNQVQICCNRKTSEQNCTLRLVPITWLLIPRHESSGEMLLR
jgi:hypothetical protein